VNGLPAPVRRRVADEAFPRRVLRMSLLLTVLGVIYACLAGAWRTAIGLGAGGVIGGSAFLVLAWTVGALIGGGGAPRWRKAGVIAIAVAKLPLLAWALWFSVWRLDAQPVALLAGLAMTQLVMVLKVAGAAMTRRPGAGAPALPGA